MITIPTKLLAAATALASESVSVAVEPRSIKLSVSESWGYAVLRQRTTWDEPATQIAIAVPDAKMLLALGKDSGGVRVECAGSQYTARSLDSKASVTVVEFVPWGYTEPELVDAVLDSTSNAVTVEPAATARLLTRLAALSEDEAPLFAIQAGKSGVLVNDTLSEGLTVNAAVFAPASLFSGRA